MLPVAAADPPLAADEPELLELLELLQAVAASTAQHAMRKPAAVRRRFRE